MPAATKILETSDLGVLALEYYNQAKASLHQGDWAGYGLELEALKVVLDQIAQLAAGE